MIDPVLTPTVSLPSRDEDAPGGRGGDAEVPRDRGLLVETSGADAGRVHRLDADVATIGRGSGCDLCFDDAALSREHARVAREGRDWAIEDAGSRNGTFVNERRVARHVLAHGDRVRLGSTVRLRFHRVTAEEESVLVRLHEASVRDGLTGLFNRRHLQERLAAEVAFAVRHGTDLCVVMFDLDHFKQVNDTHGHLAGDEVLRHTGALLLSRTRREDLAARYGGEEFMVVVRGIPLSAARVFAERLRAAMEASEVRCADTVLRPTASFGVACLADCGADRTPDRLVACADEALYRAKGAGRNRVAAFSDAAVPAAASRP